MPLISDISNANCDRWGLNRAESETLCDSKDFTLKVVADTEDTEGSLTE